jgi:signal transduction histidine kinase
VTNSSSEEALADDWRVLEDGVEIIDKEEYNEQLNKWFLTSKVPCRDEEGNIVGLFGYAFDITERKVREQSLTELQRQTQRLIETSTIKQTAEVAVRAARDVLDAPLCGVYQVDEAEEMLSPVASVESFPEDFGGAPTYSQDHSDDRAAEIVWDTFNSGTKREIDTVNSVDGLAEQTPAESALLYPLGDRGMFIVSALEPRAFDDVQKRYFELLALSLQTAFERVEREQQQQRRASQLQTLHEYSRQLVSAENYNQIGQVVLEAVDDLTQLDGAGVYLTNDHVKEEGTIGVSAQTLTTDDQTDKPRELIPIVARHPDTKIGTNPPTLGPESIAWDVYQTQTKYWTGNVQSDHRRYAKDTAVRSEGIIPLDEFGVLLVASLSVDKFNKIDQLVCQVLASNLTVALDQVHNQLELKQNRDLLSRTEQLADAGGWLYDTQTETLQWTDGTRAIHEVSSDYTPTDEDAINFYHPDSREQISDLFRSCVEKGQSYEGQFRIVTAEETVKWVQVQGEAVTSGEEIVGVRGTLRDITDQRARARQLEQQRDNLEILNKMVRHDVRNNLTAISGYTDMLENHVDEEGQTYVNIIDEQVQKATDLTESARDLAAVLLETNTDVERVSVQSVLKEEVESIRSSFDNAVIMIKGSLPTEAVLANEMLGSVFRNLLKNAVQHNDEQVPEVTISGQRTDEMIEIRVADNGPGIPENIQDSVFEEGTKGLNSGGSGIGLYLVDSLVTEFDGEVQIQDNDPKGTVFVLHLPVADDVFSGD